ncbi:MAG TPA: hypothetical protein DE313_01580 [Ruminococcus sp.]|nr:hypothetical protein [Ruminococcus sp.]
MQNLCTLINIVIFSKMLYQFKKIICIYSLNIFRISTKKFPRFSADFEIFILLFCFAVTIFTSCYPEDTPE